jgi:hypothetical protein
MPRAWWNGDGRHEHLPAVLAVHRTTDTVTVRQRIGLLGCDHPTAEDFDAS